METDIVLERIEYDQIEYNAVPELHRCSHCEFEADTISQCQRALGKRIKKQNYAYCHEAANPHDVGIIWIKTEDLPNYIALAVIRRMEGEQDE